MPDYTLGVEIRGDSSDLNKAAKDAEKSIDSLEKRTGPAGRTADAAGSAFQNLSKKLKELGEAAKGAGPKFDEVGKKMQKMGTKMSVGLTTPLTFAGKTAFSAASDYEENLNKIDVAFENSANSVKAWADTATASFGLSKNQALESAALFGDMATSMGLSRAEAATMSVSLAGLAGDLASFKNIGVDQAMTALNGVFTGETESLKQLGIVMTETNLKEFAAETGLVYDEMSQAERVQLRYNYVLSKTQNAQGDYARTADGTANSVRTFEGALDNLAITFGQQLLPIFTPIIQGLTDFVEWLGNADPWIQKLILGIGLVLAAGGPLLIFLGSTARGISSLITLGTALDPEMSKLGGTFSKTLNPQMLLIVGTIAAIIAIGYLLITHWDEVKAFAAACWDGIMGIFAGFDEWLTNIFQTDWTQSFGAFGNVLNAFFATASNIWESIKSIFSGIIDFVAGVFTGDWGRAWQGVQSIFGGIFGGLSALVKAPFNAVIGLINMAIDGINSISIDIPDWIPGIGGSHYGLNLGHISYLLHGTDNWQGGFARMNEGGRGELVYLPDGTQVIPHDVSVVYAKEAARLNATSEPIDASGVLEGMTIQIDNSVRVGNRVIRDDIANYTLKKMGDTYRATLAVKGV